MMRAYSRKKIGIMAFLIGGIWACQKEEVSRAELFQGFVKPAHFPEPVYDFNRNPITKDGFELGRKLFYDAKLSRNLTISCGSCHQQSAGFTHHGHDVSHGIDDRVGTRNALPIQNMAWQKTFFWDGGVFHAELTPVAAITNPVEMDFEVGAIIQRLREDAVYPRLFKQAFGSDKITDALFFKALAQFMLMAVSAESKYDQIKQAKPGVHFTEAEQRGYVFFKEKCSSCHQEPLMGGDGFRNNGLRPGSSQDVGRMGVTLREEDAYAFKVPSLRNNQYTAPYMHDGRYRTLARVLDHYRFDVMDSATLDPLLRQQNGRTGIAMTEAQKEDLMAFLGTLNDPNFIKNPLFSEFSVQ
jgi:cytochrome c peroxidase